MRFLVSAALHTAGAGDDIIAGDFTAGDFDGDGAQDDVAFGFRESMWLSTDALGEVALAPSTGEPRAVFVDLVTHVHVRNAGDVDGDGVDDIGLVASAHLEGWHGFRILSGAAMAANPSVLFVDEVTLLVPASDLPLMTVTVDHDERRFMSASAPQG